MKTYFDNPSVSQSQLKRLLLGPRAWTEEEDAKLYFEEKGHFIIGSGVDFCLTQPIEDFEKVYYVSELENKPSDTVKSILNQVFDIVVENTPVSEIGLISDEIYREAILTACAEHEYQSRWKDDTKISKICENWEYWEDLKNAHGKIVLSQEEKTLIDSIVMSLRTNEVTSKYFNAGEVKYQVPIFFEFEGVNCKALLDMVIFDRANKTIQPIDIKTMGDYTLNFPASLRRMRYDIQAAFYTEALKWLYPEYVVLPFKFIVESTIAPGSPLIFTCDVTLLTIGKYGRETIFLTHQGSETPYTRLEEIKGFVQLIDLYKYYTENGFEKDKIVVENNSEFNLDWSGIKV